MRFLLKWFALGWVLSAVLACLWVFFVGLRAQRQSPEDVVAVSFSIGWLLLWTVLGACAIAAAAFLIRAWVK